jgi:flagellar motor switch protein FliN/FliY
MLIKDDEEKTITKETLEVLSKEVENLLDDYEDILDMHVKIHAYLGSSKITIMHFLRLTKGSVLNLGKATGEGANFYLNDRMIGKGEVMVYEKNLAIRINEVLSHDAIIYYFYTGLH